ncbi:tRNA-guanine transglycosylase family protein [Akanthomyces lecanii RCEF 1005]|uniref:Queuine tRNA-ribosyltransferase accessory subunit 2 n=1 Tax=Akanthomyces lecanii RCEF 1005 TaxID=1081108 RepID=A0A162K3U5_CORDF|nr:tRNA-guanine transglycosylase family protein [Akanthomyces lecanii RCEF 1005]
MTSADGSRMEGVEMAAARTLFTSAAVEGTAARLGRLALPGRAAFDTPNYTSVASRGAVPHLTPDNMTKYVSPGPLTRRNAVIEKKQPPLYKTPVTRENRLHSFTGLPLDSTTILAARRSQTVTTPTGNTAKSVTLFTSTGFRSLSIPEYVEAAALLRPDIVVPLADLLHISATPPSKKLVRMVDRTEEWVDQFLTATEPTDGGARPSAVFAPVLAVEYPLQWAYLQHLAEDVRESLSGLAIYDTQLLADIIPNYEPLRELPRLSLDPPKTPQQVLKQIALGIDVCVLPFINAVSDSGVAFTFTFPPPSSADTPQPLGVDMWSEQHAAALQPLSAGCQCYTCTTHHRAYLRHLLNAKEMLGWSLLQVHNHHAMDAFFEGVRAALRDGTFAAAAARFVALYAVEFPEGTGERPRARGYHFKSEHGQEKINKTTWVDVEATLAKTEA